MSSRARFKAPIVGDAYYDAEVMDNDDERWTRNSSGDLDWAYTARTIGRLSPDALVEFLFNNAFTVPARDYNPSAPFVHIKFAANQGGDDEGEAAVTTVSLPHGYRLPLMFVSKFMWATALRTLPSTKGWREARGNIVHLCRLCENLFRRAHAKALQGGMEKGWRCIMFDRLLCRFYKHWDKNNPNAIIGFAKTYGVKEYDRDVLKHDWKRWCLRGLNGVKMTESEVIDGITLEQNIGSLTRNPTTKRWELNGALLVHITTKSDPDCLTEFSSLSSLSSEDGGEEEEEETDVEQVIARRKRPLDPPRRIQAQRQEEEEEEEDIVMLGAEQASNGSGSRTKRPFKFPDLTQDEIERHLKRARMEESLASSSTNPKMPFRFPDLTQDEIERHLKRARIEESLASSSTNPEMPFRFPDLTQDEIDRHLKRVRIEESLASSSTNPKMGGTIASGSNTEVTSSRETQPNTNAKFDLHSTSTIPHLNPGSTSPFPVLSPSDPWTPLPSSVYESLLNPNALPLPTDNEGALAAVDADPGASQTASGAQAPVASGSGLTSGLDATPTARALGPANTRQTAAPETRTRSGQASISHNQGQSKSQPQPVPAWMVLDSMVPPRGSRAQAGTSANAAKKAARAANKGKGKEKTKATKTKAQKEKEQEKEKETEKGKDKEVSKEVQTMDMDAEWSRDAAKMWPKKPLFGPYNGLHRAAVSSSSILAAAGNAQPLEMRNTRRSSGRLTRLSAPAAGVIEVPGTDSEPEFDDDDNVESSYSTYIPRRPNTNTQGSLSVPLRVRNPINRDDDDVGEIPAYLVQAKALELLVSLVTDSRTGTSGNPALAASVAALAASAHVNVKSNNGGTAATPPPSAAAAAGSASSSNAVASSSKSTSQPAIAKPTPIPSWKVHSAFRHTTAPIPGRLSPLSAAAVSQFSNQCTQECAVFNNERGRRLPHPHNGLYPPIGHRGVSWKAGAPYELFPPAYLRYERKLRKLLEEHGEGAVVGVDGSLRNGTELIDRYHSLFQNIDLDEAEESDASLDRDTAVGKDDEEAVDKVALVLEDFEERFAEVKAELVTIVERLVILENKDVERAARELLAEETRAKPQAADSESSDQAPVERKALHKVGEPEAEPQQEKERDGVIAKGREQEFPGGIDDMYVDDPVPMENVPPTGDVDMDIQISGGQCSSQTTQPAEIPTEDVSSSSTLVEKSKSSSPAPNPDISSTESIASSSGNNPLLGTDIQQGADHHSVSEADGSELTTVNAPGKDDVSVGGRAPVLTSSISLLVEELVHAKMLSVMEEMAQNKLKSTTMPADEPKTIDILTAAPSPLFTPQPQQQVPTPDVATLLAELRSLKTEFKEREQKDKEEKLAMRELHSAEVDALRRRLSYLENRDPGPMAMAMHMHHRYHPPPFMSGEHGSPGEHHSHHMSAPPGGEYLDAERTRRQGFFPYGRYGRDGPHFDSEGGGPAGDVQSQDRVRQSASSATPTPAPCEKGKSAQQQSRVETPPLPIKSQRKQHIMSFPRAKLP